jgi:hypothetical protein
MLTVTNPLRPPDSTLVELALELCVGARKPPPPSLAEDCGCCEEPLAATGDVLAAGAAPAWGVRP